MKITKTLVVFFVVLCMICTPVGLNSNFEIQAQIAHAAITEPVSFWNFDESSGNAADAKASNTLENIGTTPYAPGKINNGADVEVSSNQGFDIADASQSGLDITGNLSLALQFKPESQTEGYLISKWGTAAAAQRSYRLSYTQDGGGSFYFSVSDTGSDLRATDAFWDTAATVLSNGTMYCIVVTYNAAGGNAHLYIDEVDIGDRTGLRTSIFNGTQAFSVGHDATLGNSQDGIIDAVGIFSAELTSAEVSEYCNGGAGRQYPFAAAGGGFKPWQMHEI